MSKWIVLFFVLFVFFAHSQQFSHVDEFFDRNALINGKPKKHIKDKNCPDGSKFIALDVETNPEKAQIDQATCLYPDSSHTLIVEHIWENENKIAEYSKINGKLHGPYISRENNSFFISQYCEGALLKTELYYKNSIQAVLLYDGTSSDPNEPIAVINLIEPDKSNNTELFTGINNCKFDLFNYDSIGFKRWINRKWFSFSENGT